ncbi:hypothetical protein [Asaia bogorensis]|uniref:Lipoprotein n=1 Tax=Asaia bogorensis TaxID=91915 RepID=A0A060QAT0_9PROT|nr:hypothetical protein [Asaia bogorensis]CDG38194.1 hypothetical protein ASAP_0149 [Asaia bogorensis]
MSHSRFRPLPCAALLGVIGALSACSSPQSPSKDPVGLWTGALVTDEGSCPTNTDSTLQIGSKAISFTPGDNALVLKGVRGAADPHHYHAQLDLKDAQGKPYSIVFNGYPVGNAIGGIYGAPTCRAHIVMTRPNH